MTPQSYNVIHAGIGEKGKPQLRTVSLEDHVKYCLRAAILTRVGERQLDPGIGSSLHELLYRPFTAGLQAEIKSCVAKAIADSEPRVEVLEVEASHSPTDRSQMEVRIKYRIHSIQRVDQLKLVVNP